MASIGENVKDLGNLEIGEPRAPLVRDILIYGISDDDDDDVGFKLSAVSRVQQRNGTWTEWDGPEIDRIRDSGCLLWGDNFETDFFTHLEHLCPDRCYCSDRAPGVHYAELGRKRESDGSWSPWKGTTADAAAAYGLQTENCSIYNRFRTHEEIGPKFCCCEYRLKEKTENRKDDATNVEDKAQPRASPSIMLAQGNLALQQGLPATISPGGSDLSLYHGSSPQPWYPSVVPDSQLAIQPLHNAGLLYGSSFQQGPPGLANIPYTGVPYSNTVYQPMATQLSPYAPQFQANQTFPYNPNPGNNLSYWPDQSMSSGDAGPSQSTIWTPSTVADSTSAMGSINEDLPPQPGF